MNDQDIERVLRAAGPREQPTAEYERAMRAGLRAEWRAVVASARHQRQRRTAFALAAGILAAAVGAWIAMPRLSGPPQLAATMTFAAGDMRVKAGRFDRWRPVAAGQTLMTGEALETGAAGRGALTLPGGVSARLDHHTRLTFIALDEIALDRGALYIDAGPAGTPATRLAVITTSGSVRHVGTQYEVRVLGSDLRLRVREGRVEWQSRTGRVEHSASGEQLTITGDGAVLREAAPRHGEAWDWVAATAPAIAIEGLSLRDFLSWVARELGRDLDYATADVADEAAGVVLHGSIAGLTPLQALDAVLATTRVRASVVEGRIVVTRQEIAHSAD